MSPYLLIQRGKVTASLLQDLPHKKLDTTGLVLSLVLEKEEELKLNLKMSTIPALSFSEAADQNASLFADTQVALTGKDWLTPFTKLATSEKVPAPTSIFTTKGIRSKVNLHTEADALWTEKVSVCVCTHNVFITITVHLRTFCLLTE